MITILVRLIEYNSVNFCCSLEIFESFTICHTMRHTRASTWCDYKLHFYSDSDSKGLRIDAEIFARNGMESHNIPILFWNEFHDDWIGRFRRSTAMPCLELRNRGKDLTVHVL